MAVPGKRGALLLLLAVIVIWGVNWPVMKVGVGYMPPLLFAGTRMVIGCAVLFLVAAWAGELRRPDRRDLPVIFGVGLLQMAGFVGLISVALQIVPAGRSAILSYTTPLWVVPLAVLTLGERLSRAKVAGLLFGLAGVAVLFNPIAVDWEDGRVLLGNGLLMLAALLWAISIVQVRGHRWIGTPLSLAPWQTLLASIVLMAVALMFEDPGAVRLDWRLGLIQAYNGVLGVAFCFWAMVTVNRALPAITLSLATLATPVVGLLSSAWFLGEVLTATVLTGLGMIALGLATMAFAERDK